MNRNKKTLILILVLLILCTGISISYAYFKVSNSSAGKALVTVNGAPLCMALQLKTSSISINDKYAVPISDAKALSSDIYRTTLTIENKCSTAQSFKLIAVPGKDNTMPINAIKYALVENGATIPSSGQNLSDVYVLDDTIKQQLAQMLNNYSYNFNLGYLAGTGAIPAGTTKTYNLYLWIDENEGGLGNNATINKELSTYLALATGTTIGEEIVATTNLYKTIENRYKLGNNYVKKYGNLSGEDGASSFTNPVYYFNGAVEDNNVLFAGFCWKMVRTTETGGVKMIYNGVQNDVPSSITSLEKSAYTNFSNDATYPYTFDSTNKVWISTNKPNSTTSSITFSVTTAGDYYINYAISSQSGYDKAYFYKNGTELERHSGTYSGLIVLTDLKTYDRIKVSYTKNSSGSYGDDAVAFSVGKASGEFIKSCNNHQTNSQIGKSQFNVPYDSNILAYVGYMYNTLYTSSEKNMSSQSNIIFGNTFTYSNGTYTLVNTKTVTTWSSGYSGISSNRYTCLTTGTTCTSLYYVYNASSSKAYYITLTDGKSVDDAINEMLYANDVNKTDSTIKAYIDSWYKDNMTNYTDKLEDTVFCNDRTILNKGGWDPNGGTSYIKFKNYNTNYSLACTNETDKFSMSNSKARLTYPVGLLSAPEVLLAYRNSSVSNYYLNNDEDYLLISPTGLNSVKAVGDSGYIADSVSSDGHNVRPVVSLKPGTVYASGDGSYTNPFVVE